MAKQRVSGLVNNPSATRKKKDLARGINPDNPNPTPIRAQDPGNTGRVNPAPSVGQGKTEVRPTGAPVSANVDVTNKTQSQQDAIRQKAQIAQTAPLANQVGTATQPSQSISPVAVQPNQLPTQQLAAQVPLDPNQPQTLMQQLQGFDLNTALGAGATRAGEFGAAGAVSGLVTAGTLSLPLGAAGAVGGFIHGTMSNLKSQTAGQIAAKSQNLKTRQTTLKTIIEDTNSNPGHASENLALFNQQLSLIDKDQMDLEVITNNNLNKWLSEDGTPELQKYETFSMPGGPRDLLIRQMQMAILNPDPSVRLVGLEDISQE